MLISSSTNLHCQSGTDVLTDLRSGLEILKISGFDAADFSMKPLEKLSGPWDDYVEYLISSSFQLQIPIKLCHLPFSVEICRNPDVLPIFCEKMYKSIDAAKMIGVDYAVLHPSTVQENATVYNRERWRDRTLTHLAPFAEYAVKKGVSIALENMPIYNNDGSVIRYCASVEDVCEMADALGFSVCFDFGHANTIGARMSEFISYIGRRLTVLHVNDNMGTLDDHLPIGDGSIDWDDAMRGLKSIGFSGTFNYEINATAVASDKRVEFAKMLVERAKKLLNK